MQKQVLSFLAGLLFFGAAAGQCPDRPALWKRILFLRDSSRVPFGEQLAELLPYPAKMDCCPLRNDSTYVLLLQRIGGLYYRLADYRLAVQYTLRSIAMVRDGYGRPEIKPDALVRCYNNLKIDYDSLHEVKKKMEALDSSVAAALRTGTIDAFTFFNFQEKVNYFFDVGDYAECLSYASYAEAMTRQWLHGDDSINDAHTFLGLKSNALLALQRYDTVETLLTEALDAYRKGGFTQYLDVMYTQLAQAYEGKGNYAKALAYFQIQFLFNRKTGYAFGCKQNLNDIGYFYSVYRNDDAEALRYYFKALEFHNNIEAFNSLDPFESLNTYNNIAHVYAKRKRYDSAFYFFRKAFDQIRPGLDEDRMLSGTQDEFLGNKKILYLTDLITAKADVCLERFREQKDEGDLKKALHIYRTIDGLLARIRTEQEEITSKLFWRASNRHLYEHAIEAAYLDGDAEAAFYFFERSRAALLNDRLSEEVGSMQDIQKRVLKNYTALLELFSGDSAVYVLQVTPGHTYLTRLNKTGFDSAAARYSYYVSHPAASNRDFKCYAEAAWRLYGMIVGVHPLPEGRIVVSEDGRFFPFEALETSGRFRSPVYFLSDHPVSYTYSARFLLNRFLSDSVSGQGNLIGIAPVHYGSGERLGDLPGSDRSLAEIASNFPYTKELVLANATKRNFLREFSGYKLIQLYTHASDSSAHEEPVIYFADSALYLSELISERQPFTRLVVLSACETGNGKLYEGEGVFNFNRGFAALGIPSAIVNLWDVDNRSTYRITELFYKYLAEGIPIDVALQKAKLEFIHSASREQSLPYYWAASILVGKTDAIVLKRRDYRGLFIVVPVLFAGLFLLGWRRFIVRSSQQ